MGLSDQMSDQTKARLREATAQFGAQLEEDLNKSGVFYGPGARAKRDIWEMQEKIANQTIEAGGLTGYILHAMRKEGIAKDIDKKKEP